MQVAFLSILFLGVQAAVLFSLGQPWLAESGTVKLWEGVVLSAGNSQHLTDWYTFSHVIHGFLFYLALWYFFPRMPIGYRLLLALGAEIAWEIVENTPTVIEHYRQQALAQGYMGDSILNSVSDTVAMAAGFFMARRLPVLLIVGFGIGMELFVGYAIRDNLTLNVVGLFHQFDFISAWQSGQ